MVVSLITHTASLMEFPDWAVNCFFFITVLFGNSFWHNTSNENASLKIKTHLS